MPNENIDSAVATIEKAAAKLDEASTKIDALDKRMASVESEITVVKGSWQSELGQVKDAIKGGASKETIEKAVDDILNRQRLDDEARGIHPDLRDEAGKSLTDPWNDRVDYLAWKGRKGNVEDKTQHALDILEAVTRSAATNDTEKHFHHMATDAMIMDALGLVGMGAKKWLGNGDVRVASGMRKHLPNVHEKWSDHKRAILSRYMGKAAGDVMDTATSGAVSEWVPAAWSPEMRSKIISRSRVVAAMPRIFYSGPGKTYDLPINLTDPKADLVTEATTYAQAMQNPLADPWQMANALISAKKTFTFFLARTRFLYSGMVDEDSMVPVLPLVRDMLELGHAQGEEDCWINGQKSGAIDTAPGTYDIRNGADGFRKFCEAVGASVKIDMGNVAVTTTNLIKALRRAMGENALENSDLILIVPPSVYYQCLVLTEVLTADKHPNPTILNGALASIGGVPILPSRYISEAMNASGVIDGITTDRTVSLLVNKRAWLAVEKRDMTIESARYAATDTNDVLAMRRYDLGNVLGTGQKTTAVLYNVKTAG